MSTSGSKQEERELTDGSSQEQELVPENDAIIGRAFKWSLLFLGVVAAAVIAVIVLESDESDEEVVLEKEVGRIEDLLPDVAVLPEVRFTDVTRAAGIDFTHFNGARGEKLLPETMGGGAAFLDYDGDGDQDLFFVNATSWEEDATADPGPGHALYRNDGEGHFENATAGSGLDARCYGMGAAVGDYDGDGRIDLFVTAVGRNRLYRNTESGFVDVSAEAGVAGSEDQWTTSAGFFDYDRDGDLDLFVCHYVRWSREIDAEQAYTLNGVDRAYGPPMSYGGAFSQLYRNEGDGTFSDVSRQAGLHVTNRATGAPMGKALGVSFADFDGDFWPDVVVANDTVQNHLFRNLGDGSFEEIGAQCGVGYDSSGKSTGAMGIDVADYRNDGGLGICIGNFANEMSSLFVSPEAELRFSDEAMGEGIGSPSRQRLSFGLFFFDYDLDGRLDLLQVNGHLEESINEVQHSQEYHQPPQLFWNAGPDERSCFMEVPGETAGDLDVRLAGRGSCYADIDGDGDLDVLLSQVGEPPLLLRNDQDLGHHWLRVRLQDRGANRSAFGALVVVRADGTTMRRQVTPTRSYLSQSELPVTFGLGEATAIESIEVVWPDGTVQPVSAPAELDRELLIARE
jgi:hypothetical protein